MNVLTATLCDSASVYDNRLCILGTFDTLSADTLPVIKPQCAVALQMQWGKSEEGDHNIKVRFMNEDGVQTLEELESSTSVSLPDNTFFTSTNHIVTFQQLKFNKAGTYQITVYADGNLAAEIQLQVLVNKAE